MDIAGAIREFFKFGQVVAKDAITKDREELYRDAENEAKEDYKNLVIALRRNDLITVKRMFDALPKLRQRLRLDDGYSLEGSIDNIPKSELANFYAAGRLAQVQLQKSEADRIADVSR